MAAPKTILVVEDEALLRKDVCAKIEQLGFRALPAASAFEALAIMKREQPSLALIDVVMQGMNGFKLAAVIKEQRTSFTPVILLTALSDESSRRRGDAAGADDFLVKPVTLFDLELRIKAMLRIKDLTDQVEAANKRLAELAMTDGLTGLVNRRRLDELLENEAARAVRYGLSYSLILADVDHFKRVNDTYGHVGGDRVLQVIAARLKEQVRTIDQVARYGGEEMAVLAIGSDASAGAVLAERLRRAVAASPVALDSGEQVSVTISIGVAASTPDHRLTPTALIEEADAALYTAKRNGRNRVVISPSTPDLVVPTLAS
jgi:diguanylate cyclase (GGDEF)-like protein